MKNSAKATSVRESESRQNADGTIDICFCQQVMDPAMMALFILPVMFFTSCSGIFAVDNTFGMPGGIIVSMVLIAAVFIARIPGSPVF